LSQTEYPDTRVGSRLKWIVSSTYTNESLNQACHRYPSSVSARSSTAGMSTRMNSRWPDQMRAASDLRRPDRGASERTDEVRRADGARDVASGITLNPYPPVLG